MPEKKLTDLRAPNLTSMTFASPCLLNKLRVTSRPCRWSLRSRRDLPRLQLVQGHIIQKGGHDRVAE